MKTMYKSIAFVFALFCSLLLWGQQNIYEPLKNNTAGPKAIYDSPFGNIDSIVKAEKVLNSENAKSFYSRSNYAVWSILSSGKVYFDGTLTDYLNGIVDKLLKSKPDIRSKIKVYAVKNSSVNAITYPNGYVFVNVGLLATLKNEDQLAYILAHEIVHFAKEHAKQSFGKEIFVSEAENGFENKNASAYRHLKYSRENEFESDAAGLQLVINSPYNAEMAKEALRFLDNSDSLIFTPNFEEIFNNAIFKVDTAWVASAADSIWKNKFIKQNKNKEYVFYDKQEDIYSTHPDIEKRVLAITEILKANEYKSPANSSTEGYKAIKEIAEHELVYNLYTNESYTISFYYCLKYSSLYPNDAYYHIYLLKNLYMLGYLKSVDQLDESISDYGYSSERGINITHYFLASTNSTELKKMAYGCMKQYADNLGKNEDFLFYQALLTDTYLGKEAASAYYIKYANAFPNGKYIAFVKRKQTSIL